jgi:predicted transcriptional regulator
MIIKEDSRWLGWGSQKQAILQVIVRPMTPTEILHEARKINLRISFGDASTIIRELEKREILKCLTPEQLTGRIYCLTNYGRRLVWKIFKMKIDAEESDFDWYKYSRVRAGKTRKYLLCEIYNNRSFYDDGMNLAVIRRRIGKIYPVTLSQAFCTMQDLLKDGLVEVAGFTKKRSSKLYKLTSEGIEICEYLSRDSQQLHEQPF